VDCHAQKCVTKWLFLACCVLAMIGQPWMRIARLPVGALQGEVHDILGGLPAVVDLRDWVQRMPDIETIVHQMATVPLDVRPATTVARSGGAFRVPGSTPSVSEWQQRASTPLVFDTRRSSALHQALSTVCGPARGPPAALQTWTRSRVASLGRTEDKTAPGLAFHRHERSWLLLASGRKRWYFHAHSGAAPATAFAEEREDEFRLKEELAAAETGAQLSWHEQLPGECVLVPDGVWHCTYNVRCKTENLSPELVLGLGGMGACSNTLQFLAAEGDLEGLNKELESTEFPGTTKLHAEAPALARVAADQGQLNVIQWLHSAIGEDPLHECDQSGAASLHFAAAAGSSEVAGFLLSNGAKVSLRDVHGTTAAHWAARSGTPALLRVLQQAGADLEEMESHCGCRPLHLHASEGHMEAVRWLVEKAGADPAARDHHGRTPESWASAQGHHEVAEWLRLQCVQ